MSSILVFTTNPTVVDQGQSFTMQLVTSKDGQVVFTIDQNRKFDNGKSEMERGVTGNGVNNISTSLTGVGGGVVINARFTDENSGDSTLISLL